MASSQDAWYLSLLGLAENFRTSSPPNIKSCIQCLQAVFHFKPPPRVEARTHLQLGNILLTHTKNIDLARYHLDQAVSLLHLVVPRRDRASSVAPFSPASPFLDLARFARFRMFTSPNLSTRDDNKFVKAKPPSPPEKITTNSQTFTSIVIHGAALTELLFPL